MTIDEQDGDVREFVWWTLPIGKGIGGGQVRAHCFEKVPGGWRSCCGRHWFADDVSHPRGIFHSPLPARDVDLACKMCQRDAP